MNQDPFALTKQMVGSLGLDLSPGALFAGFVFSVLGWYAYKIGRKQDNRGVLWTGVALMVYPLFVTGFWPLWGTGAGLCATGYYFWTRDSA